jgi:hypothetical protein
VPLQVLKARLNRSIFKGPSKQAFDKAFHFLCFAYDGQAPCIYYEGDPQGAGDPLYFEFVAVFTGDEVPEKQWPSNPVTLHGAELREPWMHIGTHTMGDVYHVYMRHVPR